MWANFHTHSNYCDGKGELMDYVGQAKELGLISLGFSSHAPVPFPTNWTMKADQFANYISSIEKLKQSTNGPELYKGLEVDFIPGITSPNLFKDKLDYTIGSIHFVEKHLDGSRWEIDGTHASFLDGLSKIFKNNIKDAIVRYFELTREMISSACPTIVGHVDKIKIQNKEDKFFHESDAWYHDEVVRTIDLIYASGAIVEVNTRGVYQKKSSTTYPSPWILEIIHQKNIPVTISSDAHHKDDIVNQFSETAALLKEIGIKTITVLSEGIWKAFPYNEHGIIR